MTAQQFAAPLNRLWQGVAHAMRMRALRRELAEMDDRMLQDLGISRAQAAFEADSPGGDWRRGR